MRRQNFFRIQQLKFMGYNLIAFTIIFTIFGIIIFTLVQSTLFSKTDEELLGYKKMMDDPATQDFLFLDPGAKGRLNSPRKDQPKNFPNPRITVLSWSQDGQIVNKDQIGTFYFESYLQDYQPDTDQLDQISTIVIGDEYHFRYLLFKDPRDGDDTAFIQLMVNVDPEQTILENFAKLIVVCSIVFSILSISASYLLSKKMMTPIIQSWNKQSEFVENASHELRTPLTIIQNKLELLLTAPQEKIANKFENIALSLSETRRLSKLTSDLLTLARADSAETQLTKKNLQIDAFIRELSTPYQEIAESQNKHFWMNLHANMDIAADDVRLHQLLVILLDNALKYTNEHDSIGIQTYEREQKVIIEVSDTGLGIQEGNMPHIFDRFYREDKARSRETGGTGLGLSIAQWIVNQHNGTIHVMQNQPKGTIFKIKLPR